MLIIEKIYDVTTNEETIVEREMTAEELTSYERDKKILEAIKTERQAKEAARQALLDKLGITQDEAKLLLGGI